MTYTYALRLTLRADYFLGTKEHSGLGAMIKEYMAEDLDLTNPVSSGDRLLLIDSQNYVFKSEPVTVYHPLKPTLSRTIIHADMIISPLHTSIMDLPEEILIRYNLKEFK